MLAKVLPVLLALSGCAVQAVAQPGEQLPAWRVQQALDDWKAQGLSEGSCQNDVRNLRIEVLPEAEVQEACKMPPNIGLYACFEYKSKTIFLNEDYVAHKSTDLIIEHELRHWLGACAYYNLDVGHVHKWFWYPYDSIDIRTDAQW